VDVGGEAVGAALFNAAAQGVGVKIVGSLARQDPGANTSALVVRKALIDSGRVQKAADLKGLRIGIVGQGSPSEFQVYKTLEAGGLSPSDVQLSSMDFAAMSGALENGAIDAGIFPEPFITQLVNSGIGIDWSPTSDIVPSMQTTVLVFSPRLLADHELAVRTMMAVLCGARDYTDAFFKNIHRDQVVQELIQVSPIKDPGLYDQMGYATVDPNGKVNLTNMQEQLSWYTQMGYVPVPQDLASLYDPSIAEEAVARLGEYR